MLHHLIWLNEQFSRQHKKHGPYKNSSQCQLPVHVILNHQKFLISVSKLSGEHLSEGITEYIFVEKTCSMSYPISVPVADRDIANVARSNRYILALSIVANIKNLVKSPFQVPVYEANIYIRTTWLWYHLLQ